MTRPPHPMTILEKLLAAEAEIERLRAEISALREYISQRALEPKP